MTRTRWTLFTAIAVVFGAAAPHLYAQPLDFAAYESRIEPIFLKKRPGHARCVVCHEASNSAFRLQQRPQGSSGWSEDQSRKNFENISNLVSLGNPDKSRLLLHPLAHDAGGDL